MLSVRRFTFLVLVFAGAGLALFLAWQKGQQRHIYAVELFEPPIPIPVLHQSYTATATPIQAGDLTRVRIFWQPVAVPGAWREQRRWFQCVGKIKRSDTFTAYLLAYDGRLFVEKDMLIEPMVAAHAYYLKHGHYPADPFEVLKPDHYQKKTAPAKQTPSETKEP